MLHPPSSISKTIEIKIVWQSNFSILTFYSFNILFARLDAFFALIVKLFKDFINQSITLNYIDTPKHII
jgi:hypothetical protein